MYTACHKCLICIICNNYGHTGNKQFRFKLHEVCLLWRPPFWNETVHSTFIPMTTRLPVLPASLNTYLLCWTVDVATEESNVSDSWLVLWTTLSEFNPDFVQEAILYTKHNSGYITLRSSAGQRLVWIAPALLFTVVQQPGASYPPSQLKHSSKRVCHLYVQSLLHQ